MPQIPGISCTCLSALTTHRIRSVIDSNGKGHLVQLIAWSLEVNNYRGRKNISRSQELQELQKYRSYKRKASLLPILPNSLELAVRGAAYAETRYPPSILQFLDCCNFCSQH